MKLYNFTASHFSGWRLGKFKGRTDFSAPVRLAYYLWRFPELTETFIQREIRALHAAGFEVDVYADAAGDETLWDGDARSLAGETHYLLPHDRRRLRAFTSHFLRRQPRLFFNLLLYTVFHPYSAHKSLSEDLGVFRQALYLAGCVEERGVTHLHSPWANVSSFIALLASRLTGVTYSVQGRASADLYRATARYGLKEKFEHARFIITNCHFNRAFISTYLPPHALTPIHVIYEGLDLAQFTPPARQPHSAGPVKLLTVARLIEEKGLVYLVQALRMVKDSGRAFECEIVGGAVEPMYTQYHRDLMALYESLGLHDVLSFAGALPFDQVLPKYAGADIFVLPCVIASNGGRDVTPNVLLEAMAMKMAVVATNMTGIPEMVEHGVSGLLVPPRNVVALAQALTRLIDDAALRNALGEQARHRVEERFDLDKNIRQYLALYEE